jgi:hypothetical protein
MIITLVLSTIALMAILIIKEEKDFFCGNAILFAMKNEIFMWFVKVTNFESKLFPAAQIKKPHGFRAVFLSDIVRLLMTAC